MKTIEITNQKDLDKEFKQKIQGLTGKFKVFWNFQSNQSICNKNGIFVPNGATLVLKNGVFHTEIEPTVFLDDQDTHWETWCLDDKYHRQDKPALYVLDKIKKKLAENAYYYKGLDHRLDDSSQVVFGVKRYYIFNVHCIEKRFDTFTKKNHKKIIDSLKSKESLLAFGIFVLEYDEKFLDHKILTMDGEVCQMADYFVKFAETSQFEKTFIE